MRTHFTNPRRSLDCGNLSNLTFGLLAVALAQTCAAQGSPSGPSIGADGGNQQLETVFIQGKRNPGMSLIDYFSWRGQLQIDPVLPATTGGPEGAKASTKSTDQQTNKNTQTAEATSCSAGDAPAAKADAAGNPVMLASGNKVEFETDLVLPGRYPLLVDRTYNQGNRMVTMFGGWTSSLNRRADFDGDRANPTSITLYRADGSSMKFPLDTVTGTWKLKIESALPQSQARIIQRISTSPLRYRFTDVDGSVEVYAGGGSILSSAGPDGIGWTFSYTNADLVGTYMLPNPSLTQVTHTSGRYLRFSWTTSNGLNVVSQITDSANRTVTYGYLNGDLQTVTYPATPRSVDGSNLASDVITYHMEQRIIGTLPSGATNVTSLFMGKSFNGVRYSSFTYGSDLKVTSSEHAGGLDRHTITYNADGSTTVVRPGGRTTQHWFDAAAQATKVVASGTATCPQATTIITRSNSDRLVLTALPSGVQMESTLDNEGYVIKEVVGVGTAQAQTTTYAWGGTPRRLKTIVSPLTTTTLDYDAKGRETRRSVAANGFGVSSPLVTTTAYTDQANGLPSSVVVDGPVAGTGDSVSSAYNAAGDLASITTAAGTTSFSNFTAIGLPQTLTDPNGNSTFLTYDARGRVIASTTAGMTTRWVYDVLGQPLKQQSPNGVVLSFTYDAALRATGYTATDAYAAALWGDARPSTLTLENGLDLAGRVTRTSNRHTRYLKIAASACPMQNCGQGYTVNTSLAMESLTDRDSDGRVSAVRGNNGQNTTFVRDADASVTEQRVANGSSGTVSTFFGYDALRRLATVTDPAGGITRYAYRADNAITTLTDPKGATTTYNRDDLGLLTQLVSPDTGSTQYSYRSDGLLSSETRADGSTLTRGYTADGRIASLTATRGGQTLTRSYTYDNCTNGRGRVCSISESSGESVSYTYTAWGALATQTSSIQGQNLTLSWAYDAAGQLASLTYPSGLRLSYTWADGQLRSISATTTGGAVLSVVDKAVYLPFGPVASYQEASGSYQGYLYDLDGRVTSSFSNGGNGTYSYTPRDLMTSTGGLGATGMDYDALGRLKDATDPTGTRSLFGFDANGNRSSATYGATSTSYSVSPGSNRLISLTSGGNTRSFAYDATGNLTQDQRSGVTDCHGYDPLMRHAAFTRYASTTSCASPAGGISSSASYRFNGLNQRSYKQVGSVATRYVYGPTGEPLYEVSSSGPVRHYIWFNGQIVALNTDAANHASTYPVYADHLGRPYKVLNRAGATLWSATLKPFDRSVATDSIGGFNIGFPGQYYDNESGLWQNWHRTYDGSVGRYVQSDPIGLAGGINTFAYVGGNPAANVDPAGLSSVTYDGGAKTITIFSGSGEAVGNFPANNNTTISSNGPWPDGTYPYSHSNPHPESGANGPYGQYGIFVFKVPRRSGMGLHSGRADGKKQDHPTLGCVRTTDGAMAFLRELAATDPLTSITVINNDANATRFGARQ